MDVISKLFQTESSGSSKVILNCLQHGVMNGIVVSANRMVHVISIRNTHFNFIIGMLQAYPPPIPHYAQLTL